MYVIAHRGAKGHIAENTIAAFQKALDLGADGIELDVFLSADGEIIVFHDEHTDRLCGVPGEISKMTLSNIKLLHVDDLLEIPTLGETLAFIDRRCIVNIELKIATTAEPVVNLITQLVSENDWKFDQFLISSFDWVALKSIRDSNPEIPLGVLSETDLDLAIAFAKSINAETLHPYHHLLTHENIQSIRSQNLRIYAWTVNAPEDIARMIELGVDGLITDFPDRI